MQTISNRRVGKTDFLLHAIDLALAAHEGYDKIKMFSCEMCNGSTRETTFNGCITRRTMYARDF
jgi:hypothetical protein